MAATSSAVVAVQVRIAVCRLVGRGQAASCKIGSSTMAQQ